MKRSYTFIYVWYLNGYLYWKRVFRKIMLNLHCINYLTYTTSFLELDYSYLYDATLLPTTLVLTLSGVTKLSTHHSGISTAPAIITHGTPNIVCYADLHSALIWNVSSSQLQLTRCARGCRIKMFLMHFRCRKLRYHRKIIKYTHTHIYKYWAWVGVYIPSHPTPASAMWRQLWVKIGLLEHSSSWLALEVQATSSR